MRTQLQGSEVEAKDGISEAERVGQGELGGEQPPPRVSPWPVQGNMRSLAPWGSCFSPEPFVFESMDGGKVLPSVKEVRLIWDARIFDQLLVQAGMASVQCSCLQAVIYSCEDAWEWCVGSGYGSRAWQWSPGDRMWRVEGGDWRLGHGSPLQVMAEGVRIADR